MKFVDEATIKVQAGHGGRGAVSFRREKFIPFGGPDGGDGGMGASVYLVAAPGINTLADFRYQRGFKAPSGVAGSGNDCTGAAGVDLALGCGAVNAPAIIRFKPPASGYTRFSGDAIEVEFVKEP